LLSVMLFWICLVTVVVLVLVRWSGHQVSEPLACWLIGTLVVLTCVSGALDDRRHRRWERRRY
jgi:hypothetical protein